MTGRLGVLVAALLGVGGLGLAHLEVLGRGPAYAGPLLPLDHLFDLCLAAGLLAVAEGAGRLFLEQMGLEPDEPLERLLASAAVGSGLVAVLFLILGAVGLFGPGWLAGGVLAVAVLARRELGELPTRLRAVGRRTAEIAGDPWLGGLAALATAGAAVFLVVHGSAPPGDWDSLMYHLEVPRRWLAEGRIHLTADAFHAGFIGPIQLLYLPLLAAGSPAAPALLNGLFALLLAGTVFAVGERLLGGEAAGLATTLLWASTGLLLVATTARIDTTLAFYLLLAHGLFAAAVVEEGGDGGELVLAAVVLGLATGIKYHAFAYGAALAPVGLWAVFKAGAGFGTRARVAGAALGAFAAAALPWLILTTALLGAPFYPFFTESALPPWLAELYGSTELPPGVDPGSLGLLGEAREPFDPVSLFLAPERLTVEPEGVHYNLNPLLLLLPLWLFHLRRKAVTALAVPPLLYGAAVVVPFETTNLRYLLYAVPPLTLVTAFFAVDLLRRISGRRLRRVVLLPCAVASLIPAARSAVAWTGEGPVLGHLVGRVSAEEYLMRRYRFYGGLVAAVNRTVPEDGQLLLLWEARGFYLAPPHLQDNVLRNWPLLVPYLERTGSCLEETGITHVLVSTLAVRYYSQRGADPERMSWDRMSRFGDRCLEETAEGWGFTLYRLRGRDSARMLGRLPPADQEERSQGSRPGIAGLEGIQ